MPRKELTLEQKNCLLNVLKKESGEELTKKDENQALQMLTERSKKDCNIIAQELRKIGQTRAKTQRYDARKKGKSIPLEKSGTKISPSTLKAIKDAMSIDIKDCTPEQKKLRDQGNRMAAYQRLRARKKGANIPLKINKLSKNEYDKFTPKDRRARKLLSKRKHYKKTILTMSSEEKKVYLKRRRKLAQRREIMRNALNKCIFHYINKEISHISHSVFQNTIGILQQESLQWNFQKFTNKNSRYKNCFRIHIKHAIGKNCTSVFDLLIMLLKFNQWKEKNPEITAEGLRSELLAYFNKLNARTYTRKRLEQQSDEIHAYEKPLEAQASWNNVTGFPKTNLTQGCMSISLEKDSKVMPACGKVKTLQRETGIDFEAQHLKLFGKIPILQIKPLPYRYDDESTSRVKLEPLQKYPIAKAFATLTKEAQQTKKQCFSSMMPSAKKCEELKTKYDLLKHDYHEYLEQQMESEDFDLPKEMKSSGENTSYESTSRIKTEPLPVAKDNYNADEDMDWEQEEIDNMNTAKKAEEYLSSPMHVDEQNIIKECVSDLLNKVEIAETLSAIIDKMEQSPLDVRECTNDVLANKEPLHKEMKPSNENTAYESTSCIKTESLLVAIDNYNTDEDMDCEQEEIDMDAEKEPEEYLSSPMHVNAQNELSNNPESNKTNSDSGFSEEKECDDILGDFEKFCSRNQLPLLNNECTEFEERRINDFIKKQVYNALNFRISYQKVPGKKKRQPVTQSVDLAQNITDDAYNDTRLQSGSENNKYEHLTLHHHSDEEIVTGSVTAEQVNGNTNNKGLPSVSEFFSSTAFPVAESQSQSNSQHPPTFTQL